MGPAHGGHWVVMGLLCRPRLRASARLCVCVQCANVVNVGTDGRVEERQMRKVPKPEVKIDVETRIMFIALTAHVKHFAATARLLASSRPLKSVAAFSFPPCAHAPSAERPERHEGPRRPRRPGMAGRI